MEFWRASASHNPADPLSFRVPGRWRALVLILVIGGVLSCGAAWFARQLDRQRIQETLEFRAQWRAQDMKAKIVASSAPMKAVATFVASSDKVDPAQFHRFVQSVSSYETTSIVAWAPHVLPRNRADFEQYAEADGRGAFTIIALHGDGTVGPAPPGNAYLPIWLEDHASNTKSLIRGLDLMAEATRKRIIEQAIDEARPMASPPLRPLLHPQDGPRNLMFWPIYSGEPPATASERRARLRGVVLTGIDFLPLLDSAIRDTPDIPERISIYVDGNLSSQDQIALVFDPQLGHFDVMPAAAARSQETSSPISAERHFEVMGRQWTMVFSFPRETVAGLSSSVAWLWLAAGLLLTLLAAGYADRERLIRIQAEAMVEQRTRELSVTTLDLDKEAADRERVEVALQYNARLMSKTLDATPLAIVHLGPGGEVLVWNRGAEAIFGYSALQVIGKPLPLLSETAKADFHSIMAQMRRGEEIHDMQVDGNHKDGHLIRFNLSAEPVFEGLTFQGVVMAGEDLTQRHALEAQLRQAQKMEAIGQLTGGLAHDFNNLLLVILGNLSLLAEILPPEDEDALGCCGEARDAALRGAALIRSLLAFARRQPLKPELIEINALITDQMVLLRRTLGERVEVTTDLSADLWPVMVDAAQLEAALVNLAANARDAMPKGGHLTIATKNRRLDSDYAERHPEVTPGDHAMIEVSDTGTGMSEAVISHIFEPFFTTKERGSGTGLGLSMVFGFIKQSGGHVNVYSEVGVGTTFRLFLPRAREAGLAEEEAVIEAVPLGQGEKILVVEDNDSIRRLATRMLTQLGYEATAVNNVADALGYLSGGKQVDLLFTDIVMPGKADGLDLASTARERWPDMKILLTSGFPNNDEALNLRKVGIGLLSKPYQREELARAIRNALSGDEK
jgi:PAS domain S-box-containing protein